MEEGVAVHAVNSIINGVGSETFSGCVHGSRRLMEAVTAVEKHPDGRRLCSFQCWVMRIASKSNWCGTPTDLSVTPCPGEGAMSFVPGYDYEADRGCRRHDHGTKYAPAGPAVKLGCNIDHDLEIQGGHNTAVYGMFGS